MIPRCFVILTLSKAMRKDLYILFGQPIWTETKLSRPVILSKPERRRSKGAIENLVLRAAERTCG